MRVFVNFPINVGRRSQAFPFFSSSKAVGFCHIQNLRLDFVDFLCRRQKKSPLARKKEHIASFPTLDMPHGDELCSSILQENYVLPYSSIPILVV